MVAKRPDGIFPHIGTDTWGRNLADAVENTCAEHGVVPPPRQAITDGLATALPDTEIRGLITSRSGKKVLKPSAYRLVQAGDEQVLLLMCDVHGAAVVPGTSTTARSTAGRRPLRRPASASRISSPPS